MAKSFYNIAINSYINNARYYSHFGSSNYDNYIQSTLCMTNEGTYRKIACPIYSRAIQKTFKSYATASTFIYNNINDGKLYKLIIGSNVYYMCGQCLFNGAKHLLVFIDVGTNRQRKVFIDWRLFDNPGKALEKNIISDLHTIKEHCECEIKYLNDMIQSPNHNLTQEELKERLIKYADE